MTTNSKGGQPNIKLHHSEHGLIKDNDESAYTEEGRQLTTWCRHHNLSLNVDKTREVVIDYRRAHKQHHATLLIDGTAVERASSVKNTRVFTL